MHCPINGCSTLGEYMMSKIRRFLLYLLLASLVPVLGLQAGCGKVRNGECANSCRANSPPTCLNGAELQTCGLVAGTSCWALSKQTCEGSVCAIVNGTAQCLPKCSSPCSIGDAKCQNNALLTCQTNPRTGCLDWMVKVVCSDAAPCNQEKRACFQKGTTCSTPDCPSEGATQCTTGGFQTCTKQGECLAWGPVQACPTGETCDATQSKCTKEPVPCASVVNPCTQQDGKRCAGGKIVETCGPDATNPNCLSWGNPVSCNDGETCSNGKCEGPSCTSDCTSSSGTVCGIRGPKTCSQVQSGCWQWGAERPCGTNETCDNGVCKTNPKRPTVPFGANGYTCNRGSSICSGDFCLYNSTLGRGACSENCTGHQDCTTGKCVYFAPAKVNACFLECKSNSDCPANTDCNQSYCTP